MRLAVRQKNGGLSLLVHGTAGWFDLAVAARERGLESLVGVRDVGDLYRRGSDDVEQVRELSTMSCEPISDFSQVELAPPIGAPGAFVCIGRNYLDHIHEGRAPVPDKPLLFAKFENALTGHDAPVILHRITKQLDYEGELAVVVGTPAHRVSRDVAMAHVAGYTILNDVSARDLQYEDLQWIRGKSLDTWAPLGPVFVSADEIPDPYALRIQTTVNGEIRQDASVGDMLFKIDQLIEFITEGISLAPGDLIATGTPSGVGLGFDPPRWLAPGDTVEVTIEPIGTLRSTIVADR